MVVTRTRKRIMIANRYKFIQPIDEKGGMGEILLFEDTHLSRKVILKKLQNGVDSRRLLDEQKTLAKLRSKHVVQLFDIVVVEEALKTQGLILEYIQGENLKVGSFSDNLELMKVLWQISCGLAEIHSFGIIHRDIKPQNIKIDNEGVVKILDFGLAREEDEAVTKSVIGTPVYMAPELWGDSTISFSNSIDVYAYGILCLALVSKQPPQAILARPPEKLTIDEFKNRLPNFHLEIIKVLHKCVSHSPNERPSMASVRDVLAKYLLQDRHRATVVLNNSTNTLDKNNRKIKLTANVGSLALEYNGFDFIVTDINGDVTVNNQVVPIGFKMPGCSVLTFGKINGLRKFVTFDVSNPEVMP